MNEFKEKDIASWKRAGLYRLYTEEWTNVSYSVTHKLNVGIAAEYAKTQNLKFTAMTIYLVTRAIAGNEAFRYAINEGKLGVWDVLHPCYTALNPDGNFTYHSVEYTDSFAAFYARYLQEREEHRKDMGVWAETPPKNNFIVSIIPYYAFDSFSFHLKNGKGYYAPIFEIGKYERNGESLTMPCSITVNHAVTDLSHIAKLTEELQYWLNNPKEWDDR